MAGKKCKATAANGEPCGAWAQGSGEYCYTHDPARGTERAAARKLGGLHRSVGHGGDPAKIPARVRTLADVLSLLDYVKDEAIPLENSIQRARLLVALAAEYTNAIKVGELESRMASLEQALKLREDAKH